MSSSSMAIIVTKSKKKLIITLLPLLIFTIYSNSLRSPLILDDIHTITNNQYNRLTQLTPEALYNAGFSGTNVSRPIAKISFALDYYFNNGINLISLHITNICIHIINSILLYYFLLLTFKTPAIRNQYIKTGNRISLFTAFLWAVHPLHTQSVVYIVQRMNSLAVLFYLLSFVCFITARLNDKKTTVILLSSASIFFGVLAFGTKEIAVTLPMFILLYEFFFFQDLDRFWLKQKKLVLLTCSGAAVVLFLYKFGINFWETIPASYASRDFTLVERLLTEPRVILLYLNLLLLPLPSKLTLEHDFPLSHSLLTPVTTLPAILFIFLLATLAVLITKKERLLAFAIFWFIGNLFLESSFIPLEIVFEHRTYLPSMMVNLGMVIILVRLVPYRTFFPFMILLISLLAWGTYERNKTWASELSILTDCVEKAPNKARPQYNLGIVYSEKGLPHKAIAHYEQALRINPHSASINTNLGIELYQLGFIDKAISHYRRALVIEPHFPMAHLHLGIALAKKDYTPEALQHLEMCMKNPDLPPTSYAKIGELYLSLQKPKLALNAYKKTLENGLITPSILNNIGVAYIMLGENKNAEKYFKQSVKMNPADRSSLNNLHLLNRQSSTSH